MNCSVLIRQAQFVMSMRAWIVGLALVLPALATAQPLTFLVGADGDCDFATVQAAVNAAKAHPGPDAIHIATNATYTAQAISIDNQVLDIVGGFDTCASAQPSAFTTLSGNGGGNNSVITITGASGVTLEFLSIIRATKTYNDSGGGIQFQGNGYLTLSNSGVSQNYAGYGGGINFTATGGSAELRIEANTTINSNTAQFSGGGIRIEGNARLFMLADAIAITGNEAIGIYPGNGNPLYGYGGGVEVIGPARADVGSPGVGNGGGVIYNNTARYGGGIAVIGAESDGSDAQVRLFTIDATRPVRISGNRASHAGGGIYLHPDAGIAHTSIAYFCAFDFRFDDNIAVEGSAIYADKAFNDVAVEWGSSAWLNTNDCGSEPRASLGAVACDASASCNTIDGNRTLNENDQLVAGATILIQEAGLLDANHLRLTGNAGGHAVRAIGNTGTTFGNTLTTAKLVNCLIADNGTALDVLHADDDAAELNIQNCTIANNAIDGAQVMTLTGEDRFTLTNSIVWQPGKTSLMQSAGPHTINDVVASESISLGDNFHVISVAGPRFIDPTNGDYHLQAASPAVDFSTAAGGADLDGHPRGIDLPLVANRFGAGDLGAYERQTLLPLVLNKDFDSDLRVWSVVTPGSATWNSGNAPGSGGGSVFVSVSPPVAASDVVGLTQCIHIPGPGNYQLAGFGYGIGFSFQRDGVRLHWKYRANPGGEVCSGAITHEGDLYLPASSAWVAPLSPAIISAPPNEWTSKSSVEVALIVHENGTTIVGATSGFFDRIVLEPFGDDTIFYDGFGP